MTSVLTNKAFSQHKIPYTKVDGGVVPTLKHKFFEARLRRVSDTADGAHPQRAPPATDRPAVPGCAPVDIARMVGVETPLIDHDSVEPKEYITASPFGRRRVRAAVDFGLTAATLDNRARMVGSRRSDVPMDGLELRCPPENSPL